MKGRTSTASFDTYPSFLARQIVHVILPLADRSLSLRPSFDTVIEEPEADVIFSIAELQLFSGAWALTQKLAKALSLPYAKMDSIPDQCKTPPLFSPQPLCIQTFPSTHFHLLVTGLHEDIWTTALVLAFLRLKAIKRQTEWQLMAKKARDWLFKVMDETAANQAIEAACQAITGATQPI